MSETIPEYVRVRMQVTTRHPQHGKLIEDQVLETDPVTADRWIRHRLAVPAADNEPITPLPEPEGGTLARLRPEQARALVAAERQRDLRNSPGLRVQSKALRDQAEAEQRLQLGEAAGVVNGPDPAAEDDLTPTRRGPGRPRKE